MWTVDYDNSDTSSCGWWTITDGNRRYRTYRKEDADFLAEKLNQNLIGLGYIAFYEFEDDDIQWWIVKKEFWDENGYIDDNHLDLIIPEFGQDMESCYSYQIDWPNHDLHLQGEKLKALGFEIVGRIMKLYLHYNEKSYGGGIAPGQEDEEWPSYEDEHTDWYLTKCSLVKSNSWCEEEVYVKFNPKVGDVIYVVYVRYTTGNTFGTSYGQWKILGVHSNLSDAQKELESINDGTHPDKYVWTGYFESLEHCDIQAMVIN